MRRLALITTLLLAGLAQATVHANANAQTGREAPRPNPEARFARLVDELDLSSEQQPKVRAILEATHAERRRLMEAGRAAHDALRTQTRAKLAGVLNAEQLERFEKLAAEHGPPRRQQHRDGDRDE